MATTQQSGSMAASALAPAPEVPERARTRSESPASSGRVMVRAAAGPQQSALKGKSDKPAGQPGTGSRPVECPSLGWVSCPPRPLGPGRPAGTPPGPPAGPATSGTRAASRPRSCPRAHGRSKPAAHHPAACPARPPPAHRRSAHHRTGAPPRWRRPRCTGTSAAWWRAPPPQDDQEDRRHQRHRADRDPEGKAVQAKACGRWRSDLTAALRQSRQPRRPICRRRAGLRRRSRC